MLTVFIAVIVTVHRLIPLPSDRADGSDRYRPGRSDRGQATAEYALVLLGAATVALLLVAWAARSGKVGQLLDAVLDKVLGQV